VQARQRPVLVAGSLHNSMSTFRQWLEAADVAQEIVTNALVNTTKLGRLAQEMLKGRWDMGGNLLHNMQAYAQHLPADAKALRSAIPKGRWLNDLIGNMHYALDRAVEVVSQGQHPNKEKFIQWFESIRDRLQ